MLNYIFVNVILHLQLFQINVLLHIYIILNLFNINLILFIYLDVIYNINLLLYDVLLIYISIYNSYIYFFWMCFKYLYILKFNFLIVPRVF